MSNPIQRTRQQPPDFRREETTYVMQRWRASDSSALVGVGSVGKSNLLQHLANPSTQKHYLEGVNENNFKAIIIDPNLLGPLPNEGSADFDQVRCWAGYELMMHRLYMAFYPFEVLGEDAEAFYNIYRSFQDGNNPIYAYMGLRYFELGLDFFMRRGIRIVFMFDEFEDMLRYLPVKFFQTLRGLRDANKRQLSYLTFTRAPLPVLVDRFDIPKLEIESFIELFNDGMRYVGPYNENDARRMVDNLISRNQKNYPKATIDFLLWATGRYAGLLRSGFRLLDQVGPIDAGSQMNDEMLAKFAKRRAIREECQTLWSSLTPIEHDMLKAIAGLIQFEQSNPEMDDKVMAMLVQKRLLRIDRLNNSLHIEPPVFRVFVGTDPDSSK
jgi:hypothetical protein